MYELFPKKTNNKAALAVFLLFAGAFALMLTTVAFPSIPFPWVIQLLAVILLVPAILLVPRYLIRSYIYRIISTESGADLTVTETSGKKRTVVCRVALSKIAEVRTVSSLSEVRGQKKRIFDYRPDLMPDKSILILSTEGDEEAYICLAYDDRLFEILSGNARRDEDE